MTKFAMRKLLNLDLSKKLPFPGKKGKKSCKMALVIYLTDVEQEVEAVLVCLEMFWILNWKTQETFNFHKFSFHYNSPVQKMVKDTF